MTLVRAFKGFVNGERRPILVHFTSDIVETLSFGARGTQITLSYPQIERMVARERAKGYRGSHLIIDEQFEYISREWLVKFLSEIEFPAKPSDLAEIIEKEWEQECYEEFCEAEKKERKKTEDGNEGN